MARLASSTHSKRRSNNGLAGQVVLGSLRGHRPTRHSPSHPASQGSHAQPEAFDALLPPRYLALGDEKVYGHVPKLDSSATCFVQSRTLDGRFHESCHNVGIPLDFRIPI